MIRELTPHGIQVPDGFAVTADAYRAFLHYNELDGQIRDILHGLEPHDVNDLMRRTGQIRRLILRGEFPPDMEQEIIAGYQELSRRYGARTTRCGGAFFRHRRGSCPPPALPVNKRPISTCTARRCCLNR
jgi:phosphoenolpyruvate synthase/pyruvate phosphate dikinase